MAQLLIAARHLGDHPSNPKLGDVIGVFEDSHQFARGESIDVWIAEGLAGSVTTYSLSTGEPHTVDTSHQTAENYPGHFDVVHVPGPKEDYLHLIEEGPVRVRGLPNYKSLRKGHHKLPNSHVADHSDVKAHVVERVVKV